MSSHTTTELANGHTLTICEITPAGPYNVQERNELGTFVRFAYAGTALEEVKAWVARQAARPDLHALVQGPDERGTILGIVTRRQGSCVHVWVGSLVATRERIEYGYRLGEVVTV